MAVDDDWIRKSPFGFQLATAVVNGSVTREAITRKQQRVFLKFIKADKHFNRYYEGIYILFHTGQGEKSSEKRTWNCKMWISLLLMS